MAGFLLPECLLGPTAVASAGLDLEAVAVLSSGFLLRQLSKDALLVASSCRLRAAGCSLEDKLRFLACAGLSAAATVAASCVAPATGLKLPLLRGLSGATAPAAEAASASALAGLLPALVVCGEGLCPSAALARAAASNGCDQDEPLADTRGLLPDPGACSDAAGVTAAEDL